ncbi:MAG: TGS domain-containing protein, partial [Pseudomonadota bacterium]
MSDAITITLPDGAARQYPAGTTGGEVAADISRSLAKSALAARIDGRLADLSEPLGTDAALAIVTPRDDAALELIRHDCAHIMARAVQELWQI